MNEVKNEVMSDAMSEVKNEAMSEVINEVNNEAMSDVMSEVMNEVKNEVVKCPIPMSTNPQVKVNHHRFEYVWLRCLGRQLISLLSFRDILNVTNAFPVVCDSLFYGFNSTLHEMFMRRHWKRLALSKNDYVQTHDCYEAMYKQFVRWSKSSRLPLPKEGLYPVEPYLAWRIVSLFVNDNEKEDGYPAIELTFTQTIQTESILDNLALTINQLSLVTIQKTDQERLFVAYNERDWSQGQSIKQDELLLLIFEIVMLPSYSISVYPNSLRDFSIIHPTHTHHRIEWLDDCLFLCNP